MTSLRTIKIIFICLSGLLLVGLVFFYLLPWDDREVHDADLQPEPLQAISHEQNAAELFVVREEQQAVLNEVVQLLRKHTTSTTVYEDTRQLESLSSKEIDERTIVVNEEAGYNAGANDTAAQWVTEYDETWVGYGEVEYDMAWLPMLVSETDELATLYSAASERSRYQCLTELDSEVSGAVSLPVCNGTNVQDLSRVMVARAVYFSNVGATAEARQHMQAVLEIGSLLLQDAGRKNMTDVLLGIRIMNLALDAVERDVLIVIDTASYQIEQSVLGRALKGEYDWFKTALAAGSFDVQKRRSTYAFQPNQTLNEYADVMRLNQQIVLTPCEMDVPPQLTNAIYERVNRDMTFRQMVRQNAAGRLLVSMSGMVFSGQRAAFCELENRLAAVE